MIEKIIDKISDYNLFNYFFPGLIFVVFSPNFIRDNLLLYFNKNIVIFLFLIYFIGLIISRVGSIIIIPLLKKIKFIEYSNYKDFIIASKKDSKIELLSQENNVFRTLLSLFFLLLIISFVDNLYYRYCFIQNNINTFFFIFCFLLFLFSLKKQTNFIKKRVGYFSKKYEKNSNF